MTLAYIGIGTNVGNRQTNLRRALDMLSCKVIIKKVSSIYETGPEGYIDQRDFLNCVICIDAFMSPQTLMRNLKIIEKDMGREPDFRNAPRVIDLDILLFGDQVVEQDDLQIPHPRLHERAFVLVPLAEIAPDMIHPVLRKNIRQLITDLTCKGRVEVYRDIEIKSWWSENVSGFS